MKGDLSGIAAPGQGGEKLVERAAQVGQEWQAEGFPAEFYALGGVGHGVPVRATVTDFGPVLLAKVLRLNRTQEQSLGLIFHYADAKGLELVDLKDLRAVVAFLVPDTGKPELKGIGGLSTATAGVILRAITAFEQQGGGDFFGEPEFDTSELLRTATRLRAPRSLMGPVGDAALDAAVRSSVLYPRCAPAVDRESAYERLTAAQQTAEEAALRAARDAEAAREAEEAARRE